MRKTMKASMESFTILFSFSFLLLDIASSSAGDSINTNLSIRDGETIVSADGTFELGFFSPGNTGIRYLGIWYKKISVTTVVWVANRETPIANSSGVLKVTSEGILVLLNHNESIIWNSNSSKAAENPVAQLLNSGNLIVKDNSDNNPENFLWRSFDYPSDTLLPGMKFGRNTITGLDRYLSSWKTPGDPAKGNYTYGLDIGGFPEFVQREGSVVQYRPGPWNGLRFSGTPLRPNLMYSFSFVFNQEEIYYSYELHNISILSRVVIGQNGIIQRLTWTDQAGWVVYLTAQIDDCDHYAHCGPYGKCNINNSPVCDCLKGFVPKYRSEWGMVDWSLGCLRNTSLNCYGDGFLKYSGMKLPDARKSWFNTSMNLEECNNMCKKNCSCTAYANSDIRGGGSGCVLWFGDLLDIREYSYNGGQDIYLRMAASELEHNDYMKLNGKYDLKKRVKIIASSVLPTGMLILVLALLFCVKKKHRKDGKLPCFLRRGSNNESEKEGLELPFFDMDAIACATDNFSETNKLGEGGFGSVYKGILKDGQEIAVKRLSKNSKQGTNEFKNEVTHVAKLQHRNLVKLLGCCIQADEKMLIYEFMPHKSLDLFIFDQTQSMLLEWHKRYQIINGIARGLLYLHQDSRLRIIHRDMKAGNILLDKDMNPKISDFGLARSFGGNETEANTKKVMGTYGYMSPEYAIDGLYSVKSDVFSFGVLVLEIVSGEKNRGFCHPDHNLNLLGHAWTLYNEGRSLELVAASLMDSYNPYEVLRSIHVGLLCVQRSSEDRPSMSSVVLMLAGEGPLPQPKQPGFFNERDIVDYSSLPSQSKLCSANEVSITLLEAR